MRQEFSEMLQKLWKESDYRNWKEHGEHGWKDTYFDKESTLHRQRAMIEPIEKVMDDLESSVWDILDLCELLSQEPILVASSQTKPRVHTQIHYISHPRQTILHPQRSYADMLNEVASELTSLPVFTARVRIATETGLNEHTIKTLDPKQKAGTPLSGQELQERIASITEWNIQDDYVRERAEVEAEIIKRQELPPDKEPPISRRQPR